MVLKERVFRTAQMLDKPVTSRMLAKKMRMPVGQVSNYLSKLATYGHFRIVGRRRIKGQGGFQCVYELTGKPLEAA